MASPGLGKREIGMTPERWQRVKAIFDRAVDCDPQSREQLIGELCGRDEELLRQVEALLASDREATSLLDHPLMAGLDSESAADMARGADPMIGRTLGPYRVIREIGRGGMGRVYLAQRDDDQFRRRVALKAVNPALVDSHTLHRFENERQTLATLDHPNIIKLIDGGTTADGMPWLVMDYVEGENIEDYCASHKLTIPERLRLFRTVCQAVHYAHQNLVIHRDIKPGNVFVTPEGVPKLLDFGIAKLLRPEFSFRTVGHTRTDLQPMTPHFASPEQIRGLPVTTASDIYSLGVLLYCLVTGRHPYQLKTNSLLELERAICETDPDKPSTAVKQHRPDGPDCAKPPEAGVGEDLDMIVLMAMRKEPQRRYASAEHLSEDVRLLLEGRPVTARKDTWGYRVSKFVSRHKAGTVVAGVAALALIVTGLFAWREYLQAQRRSRDLHQFAQVVLDMDDAERSSVTEARAKLLNKAIESLNTLARDSRGNPELQRDLLRAYLNMVDVQGNSYTANLGKAGSAEALVRRAQAMAEDLRKAEPKNTESIRDVERCWSQLGDIRQSRGDAAGALESYRNAKASAEQLVAAQPANIEWLRLLAQVSTRIGDVEYRTGDAAAARDSFLGAVDIVERWAALDPSRRTTLAWVHERAAYFAMRSGGPSAEPAIRDAIGVYESLAGPNPTPAASRNIAAAYQTLADVQKETGEVPAAIESIRATMGIAENLLQRDPRNAQFQNDLRYALMLLIELDLIAGNRVEARKLTERDLRLLKPLVDKPDASDDPLFEYVTILTQTPFPEWQDPVAALRCAKRLTATNPLYLELLAAAYRNSGDKPRATETLTKALAELPSPVPGRPVPELRQKIEHELARIGN